MTLSMFVTLAFARLLTVAGRDVDWSAWAVIAYTWQDAGVALLWALLCRAARGPRSWTAAYGIAVAYVAVNIPLARLVASPFTWPMWHAAGGPLTDSVSHVASVANLARVGAVIVVGFALPWFTRRLDRTMPSWMRAAGYAILLALTALGPAANARVDTYGLNRNALAALWPLSGLAAVSPVAKAAAPAATHAPAAWRTSPFGASTGEDLTAWRGATAGQNVLVVVLESAAMQYLGLDDAALDPMPRLTALGRTSLVFDQAYAVYPESIRSLFATLCARDPIVDLPAERLAETSCDAWPSVFAARGYRTGLFHSGRFGYLGMDAIIRARGFGTLEDAGTIGGQVQSSFGVDEASTVNRVLGWIDEAPASPFVAMYLPVAGHHPYVTTRPGPFSGDEDSTRYRNALHEADAALGSLLDGLASRALLDRTTIVVWGDHGEAFGQHPGNYAHASFLFDENVRVPLVISAPGRPASGARVHRVVSLLDIAPTVLDLAGLPALAHADGRSLLEPDHRLAFFFTDYTGHQLGVRDDCWKLVDDLDASRARLFDVCLDRREQRDRAASEPARVQTYRDAIDRWLHQSAARR